METNVRTELEKSIMSNDMLGFKKELLKQLSSRIMEIDQDDLWPIFQKAAGNSGIELESLTETVYDDGIDYSSRTKKFKNQVISSFVDDIVEFITKRRGAIRYRFKKTVEVVPEKIISDEPLIARTKNISASGMLIRSRTPFKKGEKLELKVRSKDTDEPVRITGSVIRTEKRASAGFDIGVFIDSISELDESSAFTTAEAIYRLSHMGHTYS